MARAVINKRQPQLETLFPEHLALHRVLQETSTRSHSQVFPTLSTFSEVAEHKLSLSEDDKKHGLKLKWRLNPKMKEKVTNTENINNNRNNGNGNSAAAISTGDNGNVYAGPLPLNNEETDDDDEQEPNENIPSYNVPAPRPFNNGPVVTSGAGAWAGPLPNNNGALPNFDEILRNPFKMLSLNNGNGNSAGAINSGDRGVYAGPLPMNNGQIANNNERQPNYNQNIPNNNVPVRNNNVPIPYNNGQMVSYSSSSACALINGNWVCQNDRNNGNGNSAAAISTGNNGDVYAGPLTLNNEKTAHNNEPQPNEKIPSYNNVPVPIPFNNGQVVTGGAWAGPLPNNNGFIPNFDEILRNPFSMLNFPQRPQVPRN
ncbi:hypothetical protein JTE90_008081 [Oedothorax gibbosus]|uniref:Uncharacterized protein n=1 Tax=Oedothorax gibbosus TaxID=931172 RepID=A0AAV6UYC6_9ARAC|nr:hypothetical protein JTE90_008081 [Oedothorax gibbosus]